MKKIIAAALSLMMLLSVAGAFAEAAPVTVSIWSTFTAAQEEFLKKAAADFNAANPGYEVIIQSQPNQGFLNLVYNSVVNH